MRGTVFGATLVRNCYGLSGCWPPSTDLTGLPANGGFYFQAFSGSVALPAAGYDYNSVWTPCMGIWMSRSFSKHGASFFLRFFVRSESRFLRSLIAATNASAYFLLFDCAAGFRPRRRAQELSTTTKGLALTVPSTAAPYDD